MKISTKGRYGLRAMIDLAAHSMNGHVPLVHIAERQKISLNYLEQVFASLRKAKLVNSIKGAGGGYLLAKEAKDITVEEILTVLEGEYSIVDQHTPVEEMDPVRLAALNLIWNPINQKVNHYLAHTTLADLALEYNKLNSPERNMYYI